RTTAAVLARFSSAGRRDPSYTIEVKPAASASATRPVSSAWSRCTTTGTDVARAAASVPAAIGASEPWYFTAFWLICSTTGSPARSAPATKEYACSRWITSKAPRPRPAVRAPRAGEASSASGIGRLRPDHREHTVVGGQVHGTRGRAQHRR